MLICHTCDNPACVRLDHLFLGTSADNSADRDAKGRTARTGPRNPARGERHGKSSLKMAQVGHIRRLYATGRFSQQAIADRFGINQTNVSCIVRQVTWTHVK
jgi:hypothetical protein